jgi:hypothetical protein
MQAYWAQPATYDPLEFDTRFRPELLDLWLPHFVELAGHAAGQRVLILDQAAPKAYGIDYCSQVESRSYRSWLTGTGDHLWAPLSNASHAI